MPCTHACTASMPLCVREFISFALHTHTSCVSFWQERSNVFSIYATACTILFYNCTGKTMSQTRTARPTTACITRLADTAASETVLFAWLARGCMYAPAWCRLYIHCSCYNRMRAMHAQYCTVPTNPPGEAMQHLSLIHI